MGLARVAPRVRAKKSVHQSLHALGSTGCRKHPRVKVRWKIGVWKGGALEV